MISKQYFEETFSLETAQALQEWANNNLIVQGIGDYGMRIAYNASVSMFAETEVTGLTIGNEYTLTTNTIDNTVNRYRTKINALPNDNASMVAELGYGTGQRTLLFTATAETMYIAIGDENAGTGVYIVVDNISLKIDGVEAVSNGTFEAGNTTGWLPQTGSPATLTVEQYSVTPPVEGDNPYLKTVNIPVYDAGNTRHCIVGNEAGDEPHSSATYQNTSYDTYFIRPGTYSGRININRSGTQSSPLTITVYGEEEHPGILSDGQRAKVAFKITGNYWVLPNLSGNGYVDGAIGSTGAIHFDYGSSYNIVHQFYQFEGREGVFFAKNASNNTVQKSYFDGVDSSMYDSDSALIIHIGWGNSIGSVPITDNHVILNDFRNFKPMKLHADAGSPDYVDFQGTVYDSNNCWFDEETFVDNDGTSNPNGLYSRAEAGWGGVKAGSLDINNPIILSNNSLTGARPTHTVNNDPTLSSPNGNFATVYIWSEYVNQFGNVIYENTTGMVLTTNSAAQECRNCRVEKNIMYKTGGVAEYSADSQNRSIRMEGTSNCTTRDNVIKDAVLEWGSLSGLDWNNNYLGNNDFINSSTDFLGSNSSSVPGYDTNTWLDTTAGNAKYTEDYTIYTHRYTTSPQAVVIPNVMEIPQADFVQSIWDMT